MDQINKKFALVLREIRWKMKKNNNDFKRRKKQRRKENVKQEEMREIQEKSKMKIKNAFCIGI